MYIVLKDICPYQEGEGVLMPLCIKLSEPHEVFLNFNYIPEHH